MKELKTTQVSIRLTESERQRIKKSARDARMAESEYIRNRVLDGEEKTLPPELVTLLKKLLEANLAVAQDINRVARERRIRGTFSASDYRDLMQYLEKLNRYYEKLTRQMMEAVK